MWKNQTTVQGLLRHILGAGVLKYCARALTKLLTPKPKDLTFSCSSKL